MVCTVVDFFFLRSLHKYFAPLKRCYLCFDACTENATHFDETIIPVTVLIYHFWSQTMYVAKATLQATDEQTNENRKNISRHGFVFRSKWCRGFQTFTHTKKKHQVNIYFYVVWLSVRAHGQLYNNLFHYSCTILCVCLTVPNKSFQSTKCWDAFASSFLSLFSSFFIMFFLCVLFRWCHCRCHVWYILLQFIYSVFSDFQLQHFVYIKYSILSANQNSNIVIFPDLHKFNATRNLTFSLNIKCSNQSWKLPPQNGTKLYFNRF